MEQRDLGRTGLKVSALGFGCGAVGGLLVRAEPAEQTRAVARALDAGITYFDTAPDYGAGKSEENLGRALRELKAWDRVVVGTKVRLQPDDLADPAAAVRRGLEQSLKRLGTDHVHLFQLHNRIVIAPPAEGGPVSLEQALDEVAQALRQLVTDGLVGHIGFTGLGDTAAVIETARSGHYQTVQCYFNVINPSAGFPGWESDEQDFEGLIDLASGAGLGVITIRVYAAGALAAAPERHPIAGEPGRALAGGAEYQQDLQRARKLAPFVQELGMENAFELSLRFALAKPGVSTVLVGLSALEHLESAIRWAERGPLPPATARRLVEAAI